MGTKFVFERMVDYSCDTYFSHMNFMAKYPLTLFFAEVSTTKNVVTTCIIVELDNPLFKVGCGMCHPYGLICHPIHLYLGGHYPYRADRSHTVSTYLDKKKRNFRDMYEGAPVVKKLDENELREIKEKTTVFVEKALSIYNRENYYADFKILELNGVVRFVDLRDLEFGLWLHINFKAENFNPECTDPAIQMFFAEIRLIDLHENEFVETCCILNIEKTDGKTQNGCGLCKSLHHPTDGYRAGLFGMVLTAWEPSHSLSWIHKYEWRCVGGTMDTVNLHDDLSAAAYVAPSFEENGKLKNLCKDTKDLMTSENGMGACRNSLDAQHQTDKNQPLENIMDSDLFIERGGYAILEKLLALSMTYGKLYDDKLSQISVHHSFDKFKKTQELLNFLCLRSGFGGVGLKGKQEEDVCNKNITEVDDRIVSEATAMIASRFIGDLAGLAPYAIIKNTDLFLDQLYYEGYKLFMLGRSVAYNAKKIAGERVIVATEIDYDILVIDWPRDSFGKAKIIIHRVEKINESLEEVCNLYALGMSKLAKNCMEGTNDVRDSDSNGVLTQDSIQEKVSQYSEKLQTHKKSAKGNIFEALRCLSNLVVYTSF